MAEHVTWFDASNIASMNASVQVGDTSYYSPISTSGKFSTSNKSDIVEIGAIKEITLIDTTGYDPGYDPVTNTSTTGLVYANEAYIAFKDDLYGCGPGNNCGNPSIIRISKSYKEAGIIPGMSIDLGVSPGLATNDNSLLFNFSNSIYSKQAANSNSYLYVKSVNPNGDDPNEIEIAEYNHTESHPSFEYPNNDHADITPDDNTTVSTRGFSQLRSLTYYGGQVDNGSPFYNLNLQFQQRPTRVRFSFDNATATPSTGQGVYPSTGVAYPEGSSTGVLSPWYGKTKFWMIVSTIPDGVPNASVGDLFMFSKDNKVNMTSPKGYFAKAKIVNNSKIKSEMFAIAVDGYMSSK